MSKKRSTKIDIFTRIGYEMLSINDSKGEPYRWRHVVFSGFNEAFRAFFPGMEPRDCLDELAREGLIKTIIVKRGIAFSPEPALLRDLTPAERAFAEKVRKHFEPFVARLGGKAAKVEAPEPEPALAEMRQDAGN